MATAVSHLRQWLAPRRWWTGALGALTRALRPASRHPFDCQHGVDTDGLIYAHPAAPDADNDHASDRHNAGYYATAPSLFGGAIGLWRETLAGTGYSLEDYTLVDIGCGKGRVLMLASEFAFRQIVGIELNPRLARVARKNLRKWTRRRRRGSPLVRGEIRIVEGDALTVRLPDGPVALFYFNSFEREMMKMWLARLAEIASARTAPLDLIYIHPEFDALVQHAAAIRAVTEANIPFTDEDAAADAFGVTSDRCSIYRACEYRSGASNT